MKKIRLLLPALLFFSAIISCNDDEEDETSIVGRWQATRAEATVHAADIPSPLYKEIDESFDAIVEFKADGTMTLEDDGQTTEGTYTFDGDELTSNITISTDIVEFDGNFQVDELTKTSLEVYTEKEVSGDFPDIGNVEGTARATIFLTRL